MCLVTIMPGRAVKAKSRTSVPVWVDRVVCTPCGRRLERLGEQVINCRDEWHTVRLGSVVQDVLGVFDR